MSAPDQTAAERHDELVSDLRECGANPLTYGQETHGELELEAADAVVALRAHAEQAVSDLDACEQVAMVHHAARKKAEAELAETRQREEWLREFLTHTLNEYGERMPSQWKAHARVTLAVSSPPDEATE